MYFPVRWNFYLCLCAPEIFLTQTQNKGEGHKEGKVEKHCIKQNLEVGIKKSLEFLQSHCI